MKSRTTSRLGLNGKRETARRPRSHEPLPSNVPSLPISLRAHGKSYNLTEKGVRTYCEEYGLSDEIEFNFSECISHIGGELEEALANPPVPISGREKANRFHSRNLVFAIHDKDIVGIRISLKYSSRLKAKSQSS
ncbi:MAG: hypothetical protein O3B01_18880 [Planctomycetota bacterium]|nr:hypothetical protein [Planctomycetota bacterium]MDA1140638.1 hypothetical protein [Planctomycetota bacterium]